MRGIDALSYPLKHLCQMFIITDAWFPPQTLIRASNLIGY